ncbi:hypothetical protein KGO04_01515, partial [Patescibacteria group bacterium]|nr:hypothetical protein [Patescibacteria group bacterium]
GNQSSMRYHQRQAEADSRIPECAGACLNGRYYQKRGCPNSGVNLGWGGNSIYTTGATILLRRFEMGTSVLDALKIIALSGSPEEKAAVLPLLEKRGAAPAAHGPHPSHETRISLDASTYDEICVNCGATDRVPGGWGNLAFPCPKSEK